MTDPLSRIPVGQVATMGERGCTTALCAICRPQDDQVVIPWSGPTSSSLLQILIEWYKTDVEFQKLLPTQKNWEYHDGH